MLQAQGLLNQDLRQIHVDQLSDAEILLYSNKIQQAGISIEQALQMAAAKGMPATEIQKLKQRLQLINSRTGYSTNRMRSNDTLPGRDSSLYYYDSLRAQKPLIDPKIFGSELFNNATLNFEPNIRLASPLNYTVGPDDDLELSVYGLQETNFSLSVSAEGAVTIPNVGQVKVAGLSLDEATQRMKIAMQKTAYSSLQNGRSKLSVTLGNIRSIRVTIIGSNKPGNYTLSSLTTVFNALFVCGGPLQTGSFREIELIRNNKLYKKIDLYRFLVNGDQSDNVTLKDNDVIRIPSYKTRVELQGYVKRPGIFEMLPGETFANLLEFASGFADSAYRSSIKVTQFTEKELTVKDVSNTAYSTYIPQAGDKIEIAKILDRYTNRIKISGAVFREGNYELTPGMTVGDLINKADGLREDAYMSRGQIFRLKDDLSKELVSFNPESNTNILLKREDSIVIKSILELRDDYYISVQGEVRVPGFYEYNDSLTLKDLVLQSGGLTDAAYPQKIEIARLIQRDTLTFADVRASDIIEINGMEDFADPNKNVLLKPNDVVTIRRKPGFLKLESVTVSGELQYPGPYVLQKREERVSDLLKRAGGFTPEAYPAGAFIKRYNLDDTIRLFKKQTIANIQQQLNDSTTQLTQNIEREYDQIPLDFRKILSNPGSPDDVVLKSRDELIVPKYSAQVKISGSVLFPTQIAYNKSYNFKDYLSSAGGVSDAGRRSKIYVIAANGKAQSTRSFLFFKKYPDVEPGSEIIVPAKEERTNRLTTGEVIGISSALASLAGVVIAILRL
ncbi:SLBB domain-containing protein [Panacibacter ginsenosidivorans]|nr:SLBB domain-containing protein [Panacibacter ginsenosidivorans]